MSTNSTIAFEDVDGSIQQISCHFDGQLGYNGRMLVKHYSDVEKVRELIALGDISSLREDVGNAHSLDKPNFGWTVAYHRDRGEKYNEPRFFKDILDYETRLDYREYNYLYTKDGTWSVFFKNDWHDVEYELEKELAS